MKIAEIIDARGLLCPLPVLKLRKRLKSQNSGDVLELLTDDPAAAVDVPHFCQNSGDEILAVTKEGDFDRYHIRKS
ncbi:MAG: sulfurtransferase TusA family protein [Roseovarius sp.]|nr:sulfurtransferase TusA family protein [Roseovarius sp.]MCY4293210.1 sulfurtransferase TusA family protein [Roseovarius sp.]MCY4315929.1 sulfurtransferase TusA family protein [Roseovarius sp.]